MKKNNDLTGNKNELAAIDDLEINALTDDELNAVAGGFLDKNTTTTASCQCCVAGATNQTPPKTT